ncbi:hypothetical protein ES703_05482 [subsurface metagenome]
MLSNAALNSGLSIISPIFISSISNPNTKGRSNPSSDLTILDKIIPSLLEVKYSSPIYTIAAASLSFKEIIILLGITRFISTSFIQGSCFKEFIDFFRSNLKMFSPNFI